MAFKYSNLFQTRETHQSEPIPGRTDMVVNNAGGHVFSVDDWARLRRFILIGADGGSYYQSAKKLTVDNAQCVIRCLNEDPERVVKEIVEISEAGRAPKNDPAIFALAIAAGHPDPRARRAAEAALPRVCRIPSHLFQFMAGVEGMRGHGRGLRRALASWYTGKSADNLAYQMAKYMSREGWSNRDVLRLCHPVAPTPAHQSLFRWAVAGIGGMGPREVTRGKDGLTKTYPPACELPAIINAFEEAKRTEDTPAGRQTVIKLIREANLPRECIPTWALNDVDVWDALLHHSMPLAALVRNLGKMTSVGLLKPFSEASKLVVSKLGDRDYIRKSRLHPISILIALKTYAAGHGNKGSLTWAPVNTVNDALDSAFYLVFDNVEPTGKNTCLALDVSGSMSMSGYGWGSVNCSPLSPREITAAMAMVTAKVEPNHCIVGYSHNIVLIDITKHSRLADVVAHLSSIPMGGTNCSLPFSWAAQNKLPVEVFISFTDNEVHSGIPHPTQALTRYREQMGIRAKSAIVACTATNFTIADPTDPLQMDVAGFSADTPAVLAEFAKL